MPELMILVESNTTGSGRLFVQRARDLGLEPHLLSADAGRYDYPDELGVATHPCDTESVPAVLEACRSLARKHPIVGVTSSSEYFIATVAAAAAALGLPGEDPRTMATVGNKGYQRLRFAANGVACPGFGIAGSAEEAVRAADRLDWPVVVKPVSRSGSIGVRRCSTPGEVANHASQLLATTVDERGRPLPATVLVESYLAGPEYSVEVLAGEVRAVVAKHVDESRGFLEVGHDVPACVDERTCALLTGSAQAAYTALGLSWGPAHIELRLVGGQAFVLEVNARLAGGMIPQAILAATGQDLITEVISRTAGRTTHVRQARHGHASIRFLIPTADGEVSAIPDTAAALALPGVVAAAVTARPGQRVVRAGTFLDRLGYVIATGQTVRQSGARADQAAAGLQVAIVEQGAPHGGAEGGRP